MGREGGRGSSVGLVGQLPDLPAAGYAASLYKEFEPLPTLGSEAHNGAAYSLMDG